MNLRDDDGDLICYTDSIEHVTPGHLVGFFHGWRFRPTPDAHLEILRHSDHRVLAVHRPSGKVVGFVTAVTDGVLTAHIPYVEVLLPFRGHGIGRELVRRMMTKLADFYTVSLVCGVGLQEFYAEFGMSSANAMLLRNVRATLDHKSGAEAPPADPTCIRPPIHIDMPETD